VWFFPQYQFEAVAARQVQQGLRQLFERWGLPQALRVDNGQPWGCRSDLPSELMLWLLGLGVQLLHNRPYQPTENARIERTHGTTKAWVEVSQCATVKLLQQRLNRAAEIQRERYPVLQSQTRLQLHPQLSSNPRSYELAEEAKQWHLVRVLAYLSPQRWVRKVDSTGRISLYGRNYGVGRAYCAQQVYVHLDPCQRCWVMESSQGQRLANPAAEQLCEASICQMEVLYRKPSRQRSGAPSSVVSQA
jgi:hypothetical protein